MCIRDSNEDLWSIIDEWIDRLKEERFMEILPILRRTFASFSAPERQKMLDLVQQKRKGKRQKKKGKNTINEARAQQVIPIIQKILGLSLS